MQAAPPSNVTAAYVADRATADKGASGNSDSVSRSVFAYDDLSRVTTETQTIAEGTARSVAYSYDKGGNRTKMIHHSAAATATYSYDDRDRCITINKDSALLAEYTWLGNAISKRTTTCDYPGNTKPKFKTDFQRDGILRVSKVDNESRRAGNAGPGHERVQRPGRVRLYLRQRLEPADGEPAELDG